MTTRSMSSCRAWVSVSAGAQARGEQAVLRNLANSSAMYDRNPMLLQARLIQTLSTGANTIVFKAGEGLSVSPESKTPAPS